MSNGKDVLIRSEMDPRWQRMFDNIAEKLGITNGQITREQYMTYSAQREAERSGGVMPVPAAPKEAAPPGSSADPNRSRTSSDPASIASRAEERFRWYDKNGDGFLSRDEMPEDLQAALETWDTDGNGLIDLNEFKAYYQARTEQRMAARGQAGDPSSWPSQGQPLPPAVPRPVETKPLVYHADNLPKELPSWFKELDTNHDAQIGLYEWKVSGRPISEFLAMDRNNDGFLTVEEVLQYEAKKPKTPPPSQGTRPPSSRGGLVTRSGPVTLETSR
jgi:Ca2+-binding EF-hand superfamily protein